MTTTTNISSDSFSYASPKTLVPQTTCNICKRLLYSFEEILVCRVCHDLYHWRCVKPETISYYGENENYICDKCMDGTTTTNSSHRITNGGIKIKSPDSIVTDYRDFASIPSKINTTETNVHNTIRYFEEKQQQSQINKTTKVSELDGYLPSQTNEREYHQRNGQYNDGSRTTRRIQQQKQNGIESDNENDTSEMFQANYQYTPLKEYAAMRSSQTTNDKNTNGYRNSPLNKDRFQTTSRYGGGLRYSNHGYDPIVSRLVEAPLSDSMHFTSPTLDNLSAHNCQQHFISTTNLNITEKEFRRQQQQQQQQKHQEQSSLINAAPYVSRIRDDDSSVYKSPTQEQQQDYYSTVGSDSGIVMAHSNYQQQSDENQLVERKLTTLVQQLGKQLENDAQKINEKLELKLKKLEDMINQQTYIIRQQDEVIERLKSKILKIETERDHFRDRLYVHEQREQDEKKNLTTNEKNNLYDQHDNNEQDNQSNRKLSDASTTLTDNMKSSTKKTAAPRAGHQWSTTNKENEPTRAKPMKDISNKRSRVASESSSVPSGPSTETPAASSRLDNIIHQSNGGDLTHRSSSSYSLAQVRHQNRKQNLEPISMEQQQVVSSVHSDNKTDTIIQKQSNSTSSSNSSSPRNQPFRKTNITPTNNTTKTNENSNIHRSFESLQNINKNNQSLRSANRTSSLEFGARPVQYDDPGSIYMTPVEGNQSATQMNGLVKGWLRKQNRDSFLKRIERYYCVLTEDALLIYRHENDRMPHKAIGLKDAKVYLYDDSKHGPSLELTWTTRSNDMKHYHLYASNSQEADQWVTGIQTVIENTQKNNHWRPYRLST
ncbi:unnamed protein product [Rotaria sp. Silwood1]|nr:unnamed protein product [Rotaria sp. Silwood1]CAF4687290.1 unnamed protein product [Rotaria sp. Silwood1]